MLLKINERKRWMDPSLVQDPAKLALQDEEIFQTARLVKYVLIPLILFIWAFLIDLQLRPLHGDDLR